MEPIRPRSGRIPFIILYPNTETIRFAQDRIFSWGMTFKLRGSGGGLVCRGIGGEFKIKVVPEVVLTPIETSGLILYLDAANPSSYPGSGTTWYDLSGNGNNAIASGTPTYTATYNGGFTFDSVSDYFDTTPNLRESYVGTGLTVAAWVKAASFPYVSAIVARNDWGSLDGWALFQHFSNTITGPRYLGATSNNSAVTTGAVYYVAFTIDTSNNAKIYINGVQNGSTAVTFGIPTASSVSPVIGNFMGNNYQWDGDIYEIHMYNRDLSSAEMLSNFNGTKSRFGL